MSVSKKLCVLATVILFVTFHTAIMSLFGTLRQGIGMGSALFGESFKFILPRFPSMSFIEDAINGFFGFLTSIIDGTFELIGDILELIPNLLTIYTMWFIAQLALIGLFPAFALLVNVGFGIYTIYGLKENADDILGAPTPIAFILAIVTILFNIWLITNIH